MGGTSARPGPGPARPYHFPSFERRVLSNGMKLISCHVPGRGLGAARLVLEAGAENEPRELAGVAALAAAALTEGTQRRDARAFAIAAERLGADLDADAGWDSMQFRLSVPAARMEPALELMAEALREPLFDATDVERLRDERMSDLLQERADPGRRARVEFAASIYTAESNYSRPSSGTLQTVAALDADAVSSYYARFGDPASATLVLAGDMDHGRWADAAEGLLGDWTRERTERSPAVAGDAVPETRVTLVDRPGSVQSHILAGHLGLPRVIPDFLPVNVMVSVLGGLFTSRLNYRLREELGYTYGIRAAFDHRRLAGPFAASTAVETSVTAASVAEIVSEISKLHGSGATDQEVSEARDYLMGVFPLAFETPEAIAHAIAHIVVYGLPDDYYDGYRPGLAAVTTAQVDEAARTHLRPDRLAIVVVGDAAALEGPLRDLGYPLSVVRDDA